MIIFMFYHNRIKCILIPILILISERYLIVKSSINQKFLTTDPVRRSTFSLLNTKKHDTDIVIDIDIDSTVKSHGHEQSVGYTRISYLQLQDQVPVDKPLYYMDCHRLFAQQHHC